MKTGILIPAYNEATRIGNLVQTISDMGFSTTVVDDGSQDRTAAEAKTTGANVICHKKNLGKGASLKTGLEYMLKAGYDAVLIMDGDGQHSPNDIQKFIDAANNHEDIMVVGNRMDDTRNMPLDRKFTNRFMSFIVSLICGQKIPESQCGFRLLKRSLLKNISIEISVLSPPWQVESYNDIKIGTHGIILKKDGHSAVFLPQVASEQGWDLATTLTHLSQKAGLPADGWKKDAEFEVFTAIVFHE